MEAEQLELAHTAGGRVPVWKTVWKCLLAWVFLEVDAKMEGDIQDTCVCMLVGGCETLVKDKGREHE